MRLPAAQRWPALLNADPSVQVTAFCRSASSQTMSGFLPPSSRQVLARRFPAACAIQRPTSQDPVKLTTATSGCSTSGAPACSPKPWIVEYTPSGTPAARASTPNAHAESGVSSAAFRIAALPQSSAGNAFHATLAIGVLAAMMSPATPSGWRTTSAVLFGTAPVAGHEEAHLDGCVGLAERVLLRLAGLARHELGDRRAVRAHQDSDLAQDVAALHDREIGPRRLHPLRDRHRALDVVRARLRHAADQPSRRRIELGE